MKRRIAVVLAGVMALSMLAACGGKKTTASNEEGNADNFKMKSTLNWVVTSSPGGGSDIYTREISDILTKEDLVNNHRNQ